MGIPIGAAEADAARLEGASGFGNVADWGSARRIGSGGGEGQGASET